MGPDYVRGNKGLAEYLSVSVITAKRYRKKYQLPVYGLNVKSIYFRKKDIDRLIEKRGNTGK